MKRGAGIFLLVALVLLIPVLTQAQCSICTKTASQLGEGPAKGLNAGILYMMMIPLGIMGVIGYRWWARERQL
ncbi:hypothetical protein [Deminuibacter soli]|uniref:Uncharacterized protein n=1 Tax=Deminuibacter soli TaxID=2291815 RepID=A0A3E1NRB6_9BACT|nr:hypothetical protein [Deminuibacter soli]RFM30463.1 hypothetical protein DXN05_05765 [Deminuibacter soli]